MKAGTCQVADCTGIGRIEFQGGVNPISGYTWLPGLRRAIVQDECIALVGPVIDRV